MAGEIFLRLCHLMRIEDYFRILNLDSIYIIRDDLPSLLDTIDPFIASFNPRVFPPFIIEWKIVINPISIHGIIVFGFRIIFVC